jgi:hypothetical protein
MHFDTIDVVETREIRTNTIRLVQSGTSNGLLFLVRGSALLSTLVVTADGSGVSALYQNDQQQVKSEEWHIPHSSNGLVPVMYMPDQFEKSRSVIDYYSMAAYQDDRVLNNNPFGGEYKDILEVLLEIDKLLTKMQSDIVRTNITLADDLVDVVTLLETDVPTSLFHTSTDVTEILKFVPDDDEIARRIFESPSTDISSEEPWPEPTILDTGPGLPTYFYRAASGLLECMRVDAESNMIYRLTRSVIDNVPEVTITGISMAVLGVHILALASSLPTTDVMVQTPMSTQLASATTSLATQFVFTPMVDSGKYVLARGRDTVALLAKNSAGALYRVAGYTVPAIGDGMLYFVRKTAEGSMYVAGYLVAALTTAIFVYSTSARSTKRRKLK